MKINKKLILSIIAPLFSVIAIIIGFKYANAVSVTTTIFEGSDPCIYWKSIFDFAMIAAGFLTAAVVAGGGVYYVASFGKDDRLKNAKAMMTGGIVGMILAVTSWGLFNLLAPTLLQCKIDLPAVDLGQTPTEPSTPGRPSNRCAGVSEEDLFDSESDCQTSGGEDNGECEGSCVAGRSADDSEEKWCCVGGNCPVSLDNPPDERSMQVSPRSIEFIQSITSILSSTEVPDRIEEIGNAAVACHVDLGACGKTTRVIATIAISGSAAGERCYRNDASACVEYGGVEGIPTDILRWARGVRCCLPDTHETCGPNSRSNQCSRNGCTNQAGCTNDPAEARQIVRDRLASEDPDWPDSFTEDLQPGDEIVVYNGNSSYGSSHSMTFLGWADDRGNARVVQSGWGQPTRESVRCMRSTCGEPPVVTRTTRPRY